MPFDLFSWRLQMRTKPFFRVVFIALMLLLAVTTPAQAPISSAPAGPPKTQVEEVKEMVQGVEIIDPYRWLEDQNSPQTRAWIEAQNSSRSTPWELRQPVMGAISSPSAPLIRTNPSFSCAKVSTARTSCWSTRWL